MNKTDKKQLQFVIEEYGMSLDEARSMLWPVKNQPTRSGQAMGQLIDAKLLAMKDLGFLTEHGYDPKERKAAKILLLDQLGKTEETSQVLEPPQIIKPKLWTHSEVMQHLFTYFSGSIFGLIFGSAVTFEVFMFYSHGSELWKFKSLNSPVQWVALLLITSILILLGALFAKLLKYVDRKIYTQIENYRKGRIGEEEVARVIEQTLQKDWSVYLNLVLPQKRGSDMDVVLVGPAGMWVLEVKNMSGQFKNVGEDWKIQKGAKWKSYKKSPTEQVRKNAARLSSFLKAGGIHKKNYVNSAVVWVNIEKAPIIENPMTNVWTLDCLPTKLDEITQNIKLTPDEQKSINEKLIALYKLRDDREPDEQNKL